MDQLDILKRSWQSQTDDSPRFDKNQLTSLLAKKSTGIVKWLFYIAMIEFVVFIILGIVSHFYNQDYHTVDMMGMPFYYGSTIFHYMVIIGFIFLFYKNYKNISTEQPTRKLMNNILKTRRTMKWYIWYNLIFMMVLGMISAVIIIPKDPNIANLMANASENGNETAIYFFILGLFFVVFLVICVLMYLVYLLIYGILLRRLKRNYNELKRMEV